MHRNATKFFADELTLSSVDTRTNVNAKFPDRVHNCPSAADRARWAIKRRQEAVTSSIDFATAMPRELVTNKGVMLSEKVKTARALGLTIPPGVPIGTPSLGTNEEPTPRHESAAWAFGAPWS